MTPTITLKSILLVITIAAPLVSAAPVGLNTNLSKRQCYITKDSSGAYVQHCTDSPKTIVTASTSSDVVDESKAKEKRQCFIAKDEKGNDVQRCTDSPTTVVESDGGPVVGRVKRDCHATTVSNNTVMQNCNPPAPSPKPKSGGTHYTNTGPSGGVGGVGGVISGGGGWK